MNPQELKKIREEIKKKIAELAEAYRKAGWDAYEEGTEAYQRRVSDFTEQSGGAFHAPDIMIYHNGRLYGVIEYRLNTNQNIPSIRERMRQLLFTKDLFDLFILVDGTSSSVFVQGERLTGLDRPITPDEVDTFVHRRKLRESVVSEDKALYLKRVRTQINQMSGYLLSESNLDYIIAKTKFLETLEKDPNTVKIPVRQMAATIVFTAALDVLRMDE